MIKIDFHGSTHGHFLEYVSNVYIMRTNPGKSTLFNSNGAAHNADAEYRFNRLVECGHYSSNNLPISDNDTVIRITIDSNNDELFFIAVTNLIYRAGDVGVEKQLLSIPIEVRNDPIEFRNNWYSKFNERDLYILEYEKFCSLKQETFNFPFSSFYSFSVFYKTLDRLAKFLNQRWFPDQSLYHLWKEFIDKNQGWQSHIKCSKILENIMGNIPMNIDCTIIEQGWINYNLSKMCRIYSGDVFNNIEYPTNTEQIYRDIQQQLENLK